MASVIANADFEGKPESLAQVPFTRVVGDQDAHEGDRRVDDPIGDRPLIDRPELIFHFPEVRTAPSRS